MDLVGNEVLYVIPVQQDGQLGAIFEQTTTGAIAALGGGGGGGNSRLIFTVSANTVLGNAANTDYVYFYSGNITLTLPTPLSNTNKYTLVNQGTGEGIIATTVGLIKSQGASGSMIFMQDYQMQSNDFISDQANWNVTA